VTLVALLALTACAPCFESVSLDTPGSHDAAVVVDGWRRTFTVHVPARRPSPLPLVVALHGGGSSGAGLEEATGLSAIADREGFVALYPDGIGGPHGFGRAWNGGDCCGLPHLFGVDDGAAVLTLVDAVAERLPIDKRRVYLLGYSNGGALAYRLAARHSERFAALAVFAASMPAAGTLAAPEMHDTSPDRPLSVLALHSYADPYIPYHGRETRSGVEPSAAHLAGFWAAAAGCAGRPARTLAHGAAVVVDRFERCAPGLDVVSVTLYGWGHEWPGPAALGCRPEGDPLRSFDGAEIAWRFFADKRR
jgi:polyhydroxybutyrate depolymerase